jgi:transposase-like protein
MDREPTTLQEAIIHFSDPKVCFDTMVAVRWPDGVRCPQCGRDDVRFLSNQQKWECRARHPRKQFSIKTGTVFEDSPIKMDKWLTAVWLIVNAKNGISSLELHRSIGVTQKTAWFMLQRIRLAMQTGTFEKMSGEVEADETFIGGKGKNMHADKRAEKFRARPGLRHAHSAAGKAVVMGLLERHTRKVRAHVIPERSRAAVGPHIRNSVQLGTTVYTDSWGAYKDLPEHGYVHEFVDHTEKYVEGRIHTNGLENFWTLLKRAIGGTYVSVEPFHLFRYVDEQSFRYNEREGSDRTRFYRALAGITDKRLTYAELIGKQSDSDRGVASAQ